MMRKTAPSVAPSDAFTDATTHSMGNMSIGTETDAQNTYETKRQNVPVSPVRIHMTRDILQPSQAVFESGSVRSGQDDAPPRPPMHTRNSSSVRLINDPSAGQSLAQDFEGFKFQLEPPSAQSMPVHSRTNSEPAAGVKLADSLSLGDPYSNRSTPSIEVQEAREDASSSNSGLPYFHKRLEHRARQSSATVQSHTTSSSESHSEDGAVRRRVDPRMSLARPVSQYVMGSELHARGRSSTPNAYRSGLAPFARDLSTSSGGSPNRPVSTFDLLNNSYAQQVAQHHTLSQGNAQLRTAIGQNASLMKTRSTLEAYRQNAKRLNDNAMLYEFAIFMVNAAQEAKRNPEDSPGASPQPKVDGDLSDPVVQRELLSEARGILSKLADRAYPYAQFYLADGYATGVLNNGKADDSKAFPLFVAAGKRGHAESAFRAGMSYEEGWGCRKDALKAVQYYKQSATKGHPGAATRLGTACLNGELGLIGKTAKREGVRWLKRAAEGADTIYNRGPYELGLLYINGYGEDVFKDESYTAQLFTQAAELGCPEAAFRIGAAYEHGLLACPQDPPLSIHFYTIAADKNLPEAMMALSAWYLLGAEPILPKDEAEAYEWATRAADLGYSRAMFAVGFYTEMGMGCERDPLEANKWYSMAAQLGDQQATSRLKIIREAETLQAVGEPAAEKSKPKVLKKKRSMFGFK